MKGHYTVRSGGRIIGEADNLLTDAAPRAILRYLSSEAGSWAGAIAVGASNDAPQATDSHLGFEFGRGVINVRTASLLDNSVVVKASIPNEIEGTIYELGVFSSVNGSEGARDQLLIADFNPDGVESVNVVAGQGRIGRASAEIVTTSGSNTTASFQNLLFDISALGPEDRLVLAYDAVSVGEVEVRLRNSPTDMLTYSFLAQPGYNVESWGLADFSKVANGATTDTFVGIDVVVNGTGAGRLVLDGLRADDTDVFQDQVLVSRAVLSEPIQKGLFTDLEIEYTIRFQF